MKHRRLDPRALDHRRLDPHSKNTGGFFHDGTLHSRSLLPFQMPILRFLFRRLPRRSTGRLCGRGLPRDWALLCRRRAAPPGYAVLRRRHTLAAAARAAGPDGAGGSTGARRGDHSGGKSGYRFAKGAGRLAARGRKPAFARRTERAGRQPCAAGPPPYGAAEPRGAAHGAGRRIFQHQRRCDAGAARLHGRRIARDAGAALGRRLHAHQRVSFEAGAGHGLRQAPARGSARRRCGGRLLSGRRRTAGGAGIRAIRNFQFRAPGV